MFGEKKCLGLFFSDIKFWLIKKNHNSEISHILCMFSNYFVMYGIAHCFDEF